MNKRIGVLSGTFDPVHVGHIEAALVSRAAAELDAVIFLVEKSPLLKNGIAPYSDRLKMLNLATAGFGTLMPGEIKADNITVGNTLPYLHQKFADAQAVLIIGSDMLDHIESWQDADQVFAQMEICIILRNLKEEVKVKKKVEKLKKVHGQTIFHILPPVWSPVSSSQVKQDLQKTGMSDLVHKDVLRYIKEAKLYSSSGTSK